MRSVAVSAAVFVALLPVGCNRQPQAATPPNKIVLGGGKAASDGLTISSPNLVAKEGTPAISFGWRELPGSSRELAYVLVVRYAFSTVPPDIALKVNSGTDGKSGQSSGELRVEAKKLSLSYNVSVTPVEETLRIGDVNQPLQEGRVFLVDFATDPIGVDQKDVSLPSEIPDAKTPAEVESLAEDILAHLVKQSADVAEFVRRE